MKLQPKAIKYLQTSLLGLSAILLVFILIEFNRDYSLYNTELAPAAAADLQNLIKNLVESHGANLISTQVVQHESSGTFPDVRISIHMRAGIETLREIIHALESGQATLLIDNLYLQKRNTRVARRAAQVMPGGQMEELIEARFEVTGYVYQAETRL